MAVSRPKAPKRSSTQTPKDAITRLLTRNVVDVIVRESLEKKLGSRKKLRVKLGADPTAPDLHLGHAVLLWKLREFQELGHTVVLIIGDATGRIGDPSGRSKVRPQLSARELTRNAKTYLRQVGRVLDTKRQIEIRRNSEWFSRMSFLDLLDLATQFQVARLTEREDFRARLRAGRDLSLHELLYPLLQAFDSIAVRADVEIGGTDQLFNMLAGRDLQRKLGDPEQDVMTLPLLVGTDGKEKMSKSLGNVVGIASSPTEMFGKLMAIPDAAIADYARLAALWDTQELSVLERRLHSTENPRDVKADIAGAVVSRYHGSGAARRARAEFTRVVEHRELPADIPTRAVRAGPWDIGELLVALGLAPSKSAARRLVAQGGVRHNAAVLASTATSVTITAGDLLRVGKRRIVKVV